ncbi:hypothetical protein Ato02nite_006710 [Paractinoplanes toevensis]|uniref:DUF397 domain-containing protein n=1 Tax=Paractinoplanes toevensis TaxID=571911 RepID=A0A919W396_9ACTN|nr:hypothetical protein Ato02nite_006710 [Actinoplanes toevensis]
MTPNPAWRKSSRCASNTCVEAAPIGDTVLMRDSKHPGQAPLELSAADWAGFLEAVQAGDYEEAV